jgi:hypothetical protein
MKKYIGTKTVMAEPMNEVEAIRKGFAHTTVAGTAGRDGYHVRYTNPDGSQYDSWSPQDVFKAAYRIGDTPLDRMNIEQLELREKIEKLDAFLSSEAFQSLHYTMQALLKAQYNAMSEYYMLLVSRMTYMEDGVLLLKHLSFPFAVAISLLDAGCALRREGWNGTGLYVVQQIPAHIEGEQAIRNMQSLPQSAKDLITSTKGHIDYISQCLIYNENTGRADSWCPSISDVFACDWQLVQ